MNGGAGNRGGGAKLESQCGKRNRVRRLLQVVPPLGDCGCADVAPVMLEAKLLIYPSMQDTFTGLHRKSVRTVFGVVHGQANVSPPQQAPYQDSWFSRAHGNQVGT